MKIFRINNLHAYYIFSSFILTQLTLMAFHINFLHCKQRYFINIYIYSTCSIYLAGIFIEEIFIAIIFHGLNALNVSEIVKGLSKLETGSELFLRILKTIGLDPVLDITV